MSTPSTPPGHISTWQMLGVTQGVCVGIAVFLSLLGGAFVVNLIYSLLIGNCCSIFINLGRWGLARWRLHRHANGLVLRQASNVGVFGDAFPSPQPLSPKGALKAFLPRPLGERAGVRGQHASDDMTREDCWREAATLGWPGWRWGIPLTLIGGLLGYGLGAWLASQLVELLFGLPLHAQPHPHHGPSWQGWLAILAISLTASAGVTAYFYSRARLAASEAHAETAARTAAQTQLRLLQSQLEPHMLFNTLANLRALIGIDPERAQAMLDQLIAFLRATLSASQATLHPLQAEFDRLADYLALMQVRMGARLNVTLTLPPELAAHPVPPLLLQPLVENAIQHGLEPLRRGGHITVSASTEPAGMLRLQVQDSGAGLNPEAPRRAGSGFGTHQIRERLATLYGPSAQLVLTNVPTGGTLATVTLPLTPPTVAPEAAHAHRPDR
ncbi:sensor histidine kinase [Vitreoscilla filiformis]|nr:histidine kinase [Vitreoscilla filiformis]